MARVDSGRAGKARRSSSSEGGLKETIKVVVQALLIALVVRSLAFQPFNIPSGSLIPTLLVGDFLFVSKYTYGYSRYSIPFAPPLFTGRIFGSAPKRGDIAVFKLPSDNSTDYIKRVIGLPGDRIQMIDGILNINGVAMKRERIADFDTLDAFGHPAKVPQYLETLPEGVTHRIIEIDGDRGAWDNTLVYTVPPDHYFMMGDNRDNSADSRDMSGRGVGYVPFENFVGRGEVIFLSIDGGRTRESGTDRYVDGEPMAWKVWEWPWSMRWSRLFSVVR